MSRAADESSAEENTQRAPRATGPQSARFFLVRHGEVHPDWQGRIYGAHDVPLSPDGEAEAARAAKRLENARLDAIVSSGLQRAEFGAALLRESRGLARRDDFELRELERGDWIGRRPSEFDAADQERWQSWLVEPATTAAPGGESLAMLSARIVPALTRLAEEHAGQHVAIVAHGWVVRASVCFALRLNLNTAPRLAVPTGSIACIDWPVGDSRPTLAGWGMDVPPPAGSGWFQGPSR